MRGRNGWTLTSAGQEEAKQWEQEFSHFGECSLNNVFSEFSGVGSLSALKALNPLMNLGDVLGSSLRFTSVVDEIGKSSLDSLGMSSVVKDVVGKSPLDSLGMSSVVKDAVGKSPLDSLGMSSVVKDAVGKSPLDSLGMSSVVKDAVGKSPFDSLGMSDTVKNVLAPPISSPVPSLASRPTLQEDKVRTPLSVSTPWNHQVETLRLLLDSLNPDLSDKWEGSRQAFRGVNPDRLSQAAFSYRELVRMVLDELAPNVEVSQSNQESKRKRQVRQVLSGREGDFAYVLVEGLPRLYDLLSKYAHTSDLNEAEVQAALMAGEGLLLLLLSGRRHNS